MSGASTRQRGPKYDAQATENFNRLDWWLREYGHMPTREALIALREVATKGDYYRKPKKGTSVTSNRIAQAVDNDEWQRFRHSLKGVSTEAKLVSLRTWWHEHNHGHVIKRSDIEDVLQYGCDYCIQVDNYIKALCRGGQLYPGESLYTALDKDFKLTVKK